MKTHKDIVFQPHRLAIEIQNMPAIEGHLDDMLLSRDAKHAVLEFDNGYGISVVTDAPIITGPHKYECAVIKGTRDNYELVYPEFAPDVVRMDTEKEIDAFMEQIQRM